MLLLVLLCEHVESRLLLWLRRLTKLILVLKVLSRHVLEWWTDLVLILVRPRRLIVATVKGLYVESDQPMVFFIIASELKNICRSITRFLNLFVLLLSDELLQNDQSLFVKMGEEIFLLLRNIVILTRFKRLKDLTNIKNLFVIITCFNCIVNIIMRDFVSEQHDIAEPLLQSFGQTIRLLCI